MLGKGMLALSEALVYGLGAHSKTLTALNVSGNKIDDDIMRVLTHALSLLGSLKEIDVSHNNLSAHGLSDLLETLLLSRTVKIQVLNLSKNRLDAAGLEPLWASLQTFQSPEPCLTYKT
jgi:Ran GTPase-activating protein (RanGAP) involved in mRNA processing and transport